jgi:DNA polymerase III subunit epsilon
MALFMVYDTETTGLPLFDQPSEYPRQPHIVQLAARLVCSDTREIKHSLESIILPDGWEIPDEVAKIHGITTERALRDGVPEQSVLHEMMSMWALADFRLAHNESFDARIVRIALKRFYDDELANHWKAGKAQCTARLSTSIVKLPPTEKMLAAGRRHPKTPNMGQAYEFFTGQKLEGAHTAGADVDACLAVWWAIQDGKANTVAAIKQPDPTAAPAISPSDDADVPAFLRS